jgi:hypothetical protein
MSSFKEDLLAGKIKFDDIDAYITRWHSSTSNLSLNEYLGLSEQEYKEYITNTSKLKNDLESQVKYQSVSQTKLVNALKQVIK